MKKTARPAILTTFDAAFEFSQQQIRRLVERHPDRFVTHTVQGRWATDTSAWGGAYDGLLAGMMWVFHEETGESWWAETAERCSRLIENRKEMPEGGLGLLFYHGTHRRWHEAMVRANTPQPAVVEVIQQAARTMARRFNQPGHCLLMAQAAPVLGIEDLMNVPLILYAANLCNDDTLLSIGSRHVATSRRHLVRGDGSIAAFALIDPQTGGSTGHRNAPACPADSCWARGQAWAMYGFATCGRLLDFGPWLDTARQCAHYLVEKLSADPVPLWDLDAPAGADQPRDTSAAAIAAAGLLELAGAEQTVGTEQARQRQYLQDAALRILTALCDPAYLAVDDPTWEGILKQGAGDPSRGLAVNESLIWGDFAFVEALQRARRHLGRKRG